MTTVAQRALSIVAGLALGVAVWWCLAMAYSLSGIERGWLAVPSTLVAAGAIALWRRPGLRLLAIGVIAGATAEAAFFSWFDRFLRGLAGFD